MFIFSHKVYVCFGIFSLLGKNRNVPENNSNKVGDRLFNVEVHITSKTLALLGLRVPIVNLGVKPILDKITFC